MFDHNGWEGDAMMIIFPKHKGDQEGEHYANPQNPAIYPILAFAVYIWTIGFRRDGAKRLVYGDSRRFGDQSYLTIYNYLSNDVS